MLACKSIKQYAYFKVIQPMITKTNMQQPAYIKTINLQFILKIIFCNALVNVYVYIIVIFVILFLAKSFWYNFKLVFKIKEILYNGLINTLL